MADLVLVDPTFGVDESIRLLKLLAEANVDVLAAYWTSSSGPMRWHLNLAMPSVTSLGPHDAAIAVDDVLQAHGVSIPLQQIKLVKPKDPMVAALRKGYGYREGAPVRVIGASIDGVYIEDTILIRAVD